jgi:hypothetical protein
MLLNPLPCQTFPRHDMMASNRRPRVVRVSAAFWGGSFKAGLIDDNGQETQCKKRFPKAA